MKANAWSRTDLGNVRQNNEDAYFVDVEHGVFVVADGVGGSTGGELASGKLIECVEEAAAELAATAAGGNAMFDREHRERVFQRLLKLVHDANKVIYEEGQQVDPSSPPATTCDVVVLSDQAAFIAHVGDSRVYLLRGSEIFRITEDHTFAEQLRQERLGDPEVLDRYRNVLTRSIGGRPQVDVDALFIDLQEGDHLLLCSDGVTDYLTGADLLEYASAQLGPGLVDTLVDAAKDAGGKDNITAVLVQIESIGDGTISDTASFDTLKQVDILGNIQLFDGVGVRELLKIMRIVYEVSLDDGQVLDPPSGDDRCMYVVASGSVELTDGGVTVPQGQLFGEVSLVSEDWTPSAARAQGETLLLAVPARRFRSIVSEDPIVGNTLLWNMLRATTQRLRQLTEG